jgi:hypothetical protein
MSTYSDTNAFNVEVDFPLRLVQVAPKSAQFCEMADDPSTASDCDGNSTTTFDDSQGGDLSSVQSDRISHLNLAMPKGVPLVNITVKNTFVDVDCEEEWQDPRRVRTAPDRYDDDCLLDSDSDSECNETASIDNSSMPLKVELRQTHKHVTVKNTFVNIDDGCGLEYEDRRRVSTAPERYDDALFDSDSECEDEDTANDGNASFPSKVEQPHAQNLLTVQKTFVNVDDCCGLEWDDRRRVNIVKGG